MKRKAAELIIANAELVFKMKKRKPRFELIITIKNLLSK
jgi:hypothetical protein